MLKDFGFLRTIVEFCRDNERVFLSFTCVTIRGAVSSWIPCKLRYRTVTRPQVLPELFDEKDGVFSIGLPKTKCDYYFNMTMLRHADIHRKGVPALKWLQVVTGARDDLATTTLFAMRFLLHSGDKETLNDHQMLVLKKRFEGNRDNCLLLQDKRHWDLARGPLMKNTSIKRFVLYSDKSNVEVNCYDHVFRTLSRRECPTEYLDLSGRLSNNTISSFTLVAFNLTGIMLRRVENPVLANLLHIILSRPNDAKLTCLQLEGIRLDPVVEEVVLDVLDTLPISKLLFSKCSFPVLGLLKVLSQVGSSSSLEKLYIRRCRLTICDAVTCFMLPAVKDSSLLELNVIGTQIPEEAAHALAICVESSIFLHTLSLNNCRLGPQCMKLLVNSLGKSSLSSLDLGRNDIGELAHLLFRNVGKAGTMRNLFLDHCRLCTRSATELRLLRNLYKAMGACLYVSMVNFKKMLGC